MCEIAKPISCLELNFDSTPINPKKDKRPTVLVYDVHDIILQKVEKSIDLFSANYPLLCIPHYARELKAKFKDTIVTSFLDSPSHSR